MPGLRSILRFTLLDDRWMIVGYLVSAGLTLYLITITNRDVPAGKWLALEGFFIPLGVVFSTLSFAGRYERRQLEPLLARQPARTLFLLLAGPRMLILLAFSMAISLRADEGGILEAAARVLLLLGVTHLIINLSRSLWLGLTLFGFWWFMGFIFRIPWSGGPQPLLIWHPLRLAGGGEIMTPLGFIILALGILLLIAAWWVVGRDSRWLRR
jgi:hypothetical protein